MTRYRLYTYSLTSVTRQCTDIEMSIDNCQSSCFLLQKCMFLYNSLNVLLEFWPKPDNETTVDTLTNVNITSDCCITVTENRN